MLHTGRGDNLRILLDTNVIISAMFFGGIPRQIHLSIVHKVHTGITSSILLSELTDVLRKKFHYSQEAALAVDKQIRKQYELVSPRVSVHVLSDEPDNRVLEAAITGHCDGIITGDKELLALKKFKNIPIITSNDFLTRYTV